MVHNSCIQQLEREGPAEKSNRTVFSGIAAQHADKGYYSTKNMSYAYSRHAFNGCVLVRIQIDLDQSERNAPRSQSKSELLQLIWQNLI